MWVQVDSSLLAPTCADFTSYCKCKERACFSVVHIWVISDLQNTLQSMRKANIFSDNLRYLLQIP